MSMRLRILSIGLACLVEVSISSGSVEAEDYSRPPITVLKKEQVVKLSGPDEELSIPWGSTLYLPRADSLTRLVREAVMGNDFEVRFFRMDGATGDPPQWGPDFVKCKVYLTHVVRKLKFQGDSVPVGIMSDPHWLSKSPDGSYGPGHFLMVIERESSIDAESRRDPDWEVFRLSADSAHDYFRAGIHITIRVSKGESNPGLYVDDEGEVRDQLQQIASTIKSTLKCYKPQYINDEQALLTAFVLAECPTDPARSPG